MLNLSGLCDCDAQSNAHSAIPLSAVPTRADELKHAQTDLAEARGELERLRQPPDVQINEVRLCAVFRPMRCCRLCALLKMRHFN